MNFNLKAVPLVNVSYKADEFFLSISKEELLSQYEKDRKQFCLTISHALTMLCAPNSFSHDMNDEAILDFTNYVQSDEEATGLAFVVEYAEGSPKLIMGLEY